jgi:hypothetical protein
MRRQVRSEIPREESSSSHLHICNAASPKHRLLAGMCKKPNIHISIYTLFFNNTKNNHSEGEYASFSQHRIAIIPKSTKAAMPLTTTYFPSTSIDLPHVPASHSLPQVLVKLEALPHDVPSLS